MKRNRLLFMAGLLLLAAVGAPAQDNAVPTPQWRPVYHFTPEKFWTNDPNGLVYIDGVFHLYNQQNPFENKWGHMSWGHATSTDLLHWNHHPLAMSETIDKDTTWRFSGCVVIDKNNTSGFCEKPGCLVAIYTADQPNLKKESQFVAYSNDGGATYTNYSGNPVIDLNKKDFRDPNVFWHDATKQWLMVVALPAEHAVRFYASKNLKEWTLLSEFGGQGFVGANWECPSLLHLPVNGDSTHMKWVLIVSAAGDKTGVYMQYYTGDFDGTTFTNDNPPERILTLDRGDCFYAAISWNNLPSGKPVLLGWLVPDPQETSPWTGQMSIPRDLGLQRTAQGIRLTQNPVAIIEDKLGELSAGNSLYIARQAIGGETVLDTGRTTAGNAWWMQADLTVSPGATAGFIIGRKNAKTPDRASGTEIGYDAVSGQFYVDRSSARPGQIKKEKVRQTVSLPRSNGTIHLEILADRSSLEIFINHGEEVLTTHFYPEDGANLLTAFSRHGTTILGEVTLRNLYSPQKEMPAAARR